MAIPKVTINVFLDGQLWKVAVYEQSEITIGRAISNDLILDNIAVSAKHGRIDTTSMRLIDLDSANGILVDGKPVAFAKINYGQKFRISKFTLEVRPFQDGDKPAVFNISHKKSLISKKQSIDPVKINQRNTYFFITVTFVLGSITFYLLQNQNESRLTQNPQAETVSPKEHSVDAVDVPEKKPEDFDKVSVLKSGQKISMPWHEDGWSRCVSEYKRLYSVNRHPIFFKYADDVCAYDHPKFDHLKQQAGQCYMIIRSPDSLRGQDFKIDYMCVEHSVATPSNEPICTNAKDFYNEVITARMINDGRCATFPNLLGTQVNKVYPEKIKKGLEKYNTTGEYSDLPYELRFSNQNKDPACKSLVDSIRALENRSDFEHNEETQRLWNSKAQMAISMKCSF